MATAFSERITIILPLARVAAMGVYWSAQIDPSDDCSTWPPLNPSGLDTDPVTHSWCCTALTMPQLKKIMQRLCNVASITPPANWDTMTRAEKRQWLLSNRAAIRTATGIWIGHTPNEGAWERFDDHLDTLSIKRRQRAGAP